MASEFMPVFAVNRFNLLKKLNKFDGSYGVLGTVVESDNFLHSLRDSGKTFFIDSGVFDDNKNNWYRQTISTYEDHRWVRRQTLASLDELRKWIAAFFKRCDYFSPDYVFAPDVIGEPLLSLYLNKLAWEEYSLKERFYQLIGVVQAGHALYNWPVNIVPKHDSLLPFFNTPKSFLSSLISEYHHTGYQHIALGGLLRAESTMPMGLKFGLSNQELDDILSWSRPRFVLGGLALTRLAVLKKHRVWADSTNWLWWDERYDHGRFENRNAIQEVLN